MIGLPIVLLVAAGLAEPVPWIGTGRVPPAAAGAARVLWVGADEGETPACALVSASEWKCTAPQRPAAGLLVFVDEAKVSYVALGSNEPATARWGRVVRLLRPDEAPGAVRVTAWRPERSPMRAGTRYFLPVAEPGAAVTPLAADTFWVAFDEVDKEAFIQIDGDAVATARLSIADLEGADLTQPAFVSLRAPQTLHGSVRSRREAGVEGADVQLYAPIGAQPFRPATVDTDGERAWVRIARARTDSEGAFAFEALEPGTFELEARHPLLGRARTRVESVAEPAVVTLTDTGRATGRVLRSGAPVAGAQVRVVPDAAAWQRTADTGASLTARTSTDTDGRFSLALPASRDGTIQIVAPDGAALRIPLVASSGDVDIGNVSLPAPIPVTVRVLDPIGACALFAVGPLGGLGLSVVSGAAGVNAFDLLLPEAGEWALTLQCAGRDLPVSPPVMNLAPGTNGATVDVRLAR